MKISVNRNELIKSKGSVEITLPESISIENEQELNEILAEILTCRIKGDENESTN